VHPKSTTSAAAQLQPAATPSLQAYQLGELPECQVGCARDILGPKIIEIRGVVHPAESSTGGITGNLESLSDIFSSGRELVGQIFLRIPISKTDKPSRSIEI